MPRGMKGLGSLCYCLLTMFTYTPSEPLLKLLESLNSDLEIFPGEGAFDHLYWTYDEAFEQLFGPGKGELKKHFPKFKCSGRMWKFRFDWYINRWMEAASA